MEHLPGQADLLRRGHRGGGDHQPLLLHPEGVRAQGQRRVKPQTEWLYRRYNPQLTERTLTFIPYYAFANRGETDMRVWVPVG